MTAKDRKQKKAQDGGRERAETAAPPPQSFGAIVREWCDTLVFAFILAMFIRIFVVELFRIPSGSMSPTLIGDYVYEFDMDGNHEDDLLVFDPLHPQPPPYNVYLKQDGAYRQHRHLSLNNLRELRLNDVKIHGQRYDRIIVNKMAYLFSGPARGDIAVFKTPEHIFDRDKPIFVKRVCALPNELVDIENYQDPATGGRLIIDGKVVEQPEIYKLRRYTKPSDAHPFPQRTQADRYLMFGDNTWNSSDSRFWGPVPGINFKGRAFLRYWPLRGVGKLENFGLLERSNPKIRWVLFVLYLGIAYVLVTVYSQFDQKWKMAIARSAGA